MVVRMWKTARVSEEEGVGDGMQGGVAPSDLFVQEEKEFCRRGDGVRERRR